METMETSSGKENLTFGMVTRVVKLSKLQIRAVFAVMGAAVPDDDTLLYADEMRHLLLADLLENLKFLKAEQRTVILTGVWAGMTRQGACCAPNQLVFADSRYCTWEGNTGWLDLETGDNIVTLPCPPLETIAYNLNELHRQARTAIENRSGSNGKRNAGSMEEQGYVRVSSPDAVHGQVRDRGPDVGPDDDHARN